MIVPLRKTNAAPTSSDLDVLERLPARDDAAGDLAETLASVGADLRVSSDSIFRAWARRERPSENILRTARAAAERALRALEQAEGALLTIINGGE